MIRSRSAVARARPWMASATAWSTTNAPARRSRAARIGASARVRPSRYGDKRDERRERATVRAASRSRSTRHRPAAPRCRTRDTVSSSPTMLDATSARGLRARGCSCQSPCSSWPSFGKVILLDQEVRLGASTLAGAGWTADRGPGCPRRGSDRAAPSSPGSIRPSPGSAACRRAVLGQVAIGAPR